jgi:hypothetical protein
MAQTELKLKQASAVLGIPPKDLQNLVQFRVVRPKRRGIEYRFDQNALLEAKVAWYLKRSLGVSTAYLSRIVPKVSKAQVENAAKVELLISSRMPGSSVVIQVKVPVRKLRRELNEQMPLAGLYRDLPRGRRRPGWKAEFLEAVRQAAADLGQVSEDQIKQTVRAYRDERRCEPEITIA